jgi:hypothetical protein
VVSKYILYVNNHFKFIMSCLWPSLWYFITSVPCSPKKEGMVIALFRFSFFIPPFPLPFLTSSPSLSPLSLYWCLNSGLYHLSHTFILFLLSIVFPIGSHDFGWPGLGLWSFSPCSPISGFTGIYHCYLLYFVELGSCWLFAWPGLELWSSWSPPPE